MKIESVVFSRIALLGALVFILSGTTFSAKAQGLVQEQASEQEFNQDPQTSFPQQDMVSFQAEVNTALANPSQKYFVIQNVATETTRVYEKCSGSSCQHKLIFESEMVVGRRKSTFFNAKEWFTHLGVTKIRKWEKFHQDGQGHYPAWYSSKYPKIPPPGADFSDWFNRDIMPDSRGVMRGAFGWFTAMLSPNAQTQWMHGTAGWGADGDKYIAVTRNAFLSMISDARSSGCTRLENGAISYLRHILPIGTPIIRVYAKEAVEDSRLSRYKSQKTTQPFYYILTRTNKINDSNADTIERNAVIARGVPQSEWMEEGVYNVDRYPSVREYHLTPGWIGAGSGKIGNIYRIFFYEFEGHFLIDSGRFVNYKHPSSLPVSGMSGIVVPDYTKAPSSVSPLEPEDQD